MTSSSSEYPSSGTSNGIFAVFILQLIFSGFAWSTLDDPMQKKIAFAEIAVSFIFAMILVYMNEQHHSAFIGQIILCASNGLLALPPAQIGVFFFPASNDVRNIAILLSVISFLIEWFVWFSYHRNKYDLLSDEIEQPGRIDIKNGYWAIDKPLITKQEARSSERWANISKLAGPLGPIIGLLLFRSSSSVDLPFVMSSLFLIIAFLMFMLCGIQAAMASEILRAEKKLGKRIVLHST